MGGFAGTEVSSGGYPFLLRNCSAVGSLPGLLGEVVGAYKWWPHCQCLGPPGLGIF